MAEKALEAGFENFLGVTGIDPWAEAIEDEMFMWEGYNTVRLLFLEIDLTCWSFLA